MRRTSRKIYTMHYHCYSTQCHDIQNNCLFILLTHLYPTISTDYVPICSTANTSRSLASIFPNQAYNSLLTFVRNPPRQSRNPSSPPTQPPPPKTLPPRPSPTIHRFSLHLHTSPSIPRLGPFSRRIARNRRNNHLRVRTPSCIPHSSNRGIVQ